MRKYATGKATKMILQGGFAAVGVLFLFFCILLPAPSRAGGPTDQMRATVDKVLTIVRNPNLKSEAEKKTLEPDWLKSFIPGSTLSKWPSAPWDLTGRPGAPKIGGSS